MRDMPQRDQPKLRVKPGGAGRGGRPPAGFNGEPTSKYPQLATRVPPATLESLRALAMNERRSMWRIIVDAVEIYARRETTPSRQ
jgi:hypothetical protein